MNYIDITFYIILSFYQTLAKPRKLFVQILFPLILFGFSIITKFHISYIYVSVIHKYVQIFQLTSSYLIFFYIIDLVFESENSLTLISLLFSSWFWVNVILKWLFYLLQPLQVGNIVHVIYFSHTSAVYILSFHHLMSGAIFVLRLNRNNIRF